MAKKIEEMTEAEIDAELASFDKPTNLKPVEEMTEQEIDAELGIAQAKDETRGTSGQLLGKALQGATLGFSDELTGAINAAGTAAGIDVENASFREEGPTLDWEVLKDAYRRARDKERLMLSKASEEMPIVSGATEMAGSLVTAPLSAGMSAIKGGLAAGAAYGLGTSEEENLLSQAQDAAKSAALGGAVGAGLQGLGKLTKPLSEKIAKSGLAKGMGSTAEELAVSAAGAQKSQARALREKGNLNTIGRFLLEEKIVTPIATAKNMSKKISEKMNEKINSLTELIRSSDEDLGKILRSGNVDQETLEIARSGQVSTEVLKDRVKQSIYEFFEGIPEEEIAPALNKVDIWFANKPEAMSIKDLQQIKVGLNNFLKSGDFYKEIIGSPAKVGLLEIRSGVKEAIEQKADAAAMLGGKSSGVLKKTNRELGNLFEAEKLVDNALDREAGNRMFSLTDYLSANPGAIIGEAVRGNVGAAVGAGGAMLANKGLRQYGAGLAATGIDGIRKAMIQSPELAGFLQNNPALIQNILAPMRTREDIENDQSMTPSERAKTLMEMQRLGM